MKKVIITTAVILAFTSSANAAENCQEKINVKVNGLVCDFCARAIEKTFGSREEVSAIKVDLSKGDITITAKQGKTIDDATLTKLITDAGYDVKNINKGC